MRPSRATSGIGQVWKLSSTLIAIWRPLAGGGVVDGAQLLVALPGKIDFPVGVAGVEAPGELGLLALGEVFHAVAEQPADLVQRVVFVASVAEGVLLHPAADLVDDLSPEPDDMEGVEDRHRVGQLVTDRVGIAAERIQARPVRRRR